jgi:hypothetical protein
VAPSLFDLTRGQRGEGSKRVVCAEDRRDADSRRHRDALLQAHVTGLDVAVQRLDHPEETERDRETERALLGPEDLERVSDFLKRSLERRVEMREQASRERSSPRPAVRWAGLGLKSLVT